MSASAVRREAFGWKQPFWPPLLLAVLCFLAYSNSLHNQFMLDDYLVLFGETGVAELDSSVDMFGDYQGAFYRPVGHLFLVASHRMFGTNEVGYHSANLVLLFVICLLFFCITELLFENRQLSFLTAALYAVHPINNALVNYITLNVSGIFVVCLQLSLILFLLFLREGRIVSYVLSLLFLVFGLLSHEMSLLFPVYLVCILYFLKRFTLRRMIWVGLPYGLICLGYLVFRSYLFRLQSVFDNSVTGLDTSVSGFIAALAKLIFWYISQLISMGGTLFLWTEVYATVQVAGTLILSIAVVAAFIYLVFVRLKRGLPAFALAFFATGFLPIGAASFSYFPHAEPIIEPHWFYFASLGFFLLVAHVLLSLKEVVRGKVWVMLVCFVFANGVVQVRLSNTLWKDEQTYCFYWMSRNPHNLTPYVGLSRALLEKGRCRDSIVIAREGLEMVKSTLLKNVSGLEPEARSRIQTNRVAYNDIISTNLGTAYMCSGNYEAALESYLTAITVNPGAARPYHYMGRLLLKNRLYEPAGKAFANAFRLNPRSVSSYNFLLAVQAESQGRVADATALIDEAEKLQAGMDGYAGTPDSFQP